MIESKTCLLTGCLSGIGKATLIHLAERGYNILAGIQFSDKQFLDFCNDLSRKNKTKIIPIVFDLQDENSIKTAVKEIRKTQLDVDSLVNIAGMTIDSNSLMASSSDMTKVYKINVVSQILLTQYILRLMLRKKSGSIIFISSISALDGMPGQLSYSSSKGALISATKTFSREFAKNGIRFNCIAPGIINTQMNEIVPEEILEERLHRTALKRIGMPSEVASTIEFLISDLSSYVTGQVIRVDGGFK